AGAQRVHPQIDGVVPGGQAREMADRLDFAHLGEIFDLLANISGAEDGPGVDRRHVELGKLVSLFAGRAALEQERLVLRDVRQNLVDHAENTSAAAFIWSM